MTTMSTFAKTIMEQKYSHTKSDGSKESWEEISKRVVKHVMKAIDYKMSNPLCKELVQIITDRKFIPGGRYLYAAGKPFHQVQNCLLLKAEDSREDWADLMYKVTVGLMTGAGIGVDYSSVRAEGKLIRKTGGTSTGPIALMQMVNESGRGIMQGGSRRSAIWAGLNWKHPDTHKFIQMKNWSPEVRALKEKDFNFPATMDGTNISVQLDDEFFKAYHDESNPLNIHAHSIYWSVVRQMLKTAEPGFSVDLGSNHGESLRNACVIGETEILTKDGYKRIDSLIDQPVEIWNGFEWSTVAPRITGEKIPVKKITFNDGNTLICTDYHKFHIASNYLGKVDIYETKDLLPGMRLIKHKLPVIEGNLELKEAYIQGFHSAEGMDGYNHMYVYEPKYACLGRLSCYGGKISKDYGGKKVFRPEYKFLPKTFIPFNYTLRTKLDWLSGLFDGDGCELKEGGLQLVSVDKNFINNLQKLLTTLGIKSKIALAQESGFRPMPDGKGSSKDYFCQTSYRICVGAVQMQELKSLGLTCQRLNFNKNPQRDASQFVKIISIEDAGIADKVYCFNEPLRHLALFNGVITGQCTELTSHDDSDICNIGSINLARITSLEEMKRVVELSTLFLLAGTIYSHVPYNKVDQVRTKNRRLGLGLMGIHEWLLMRSKPYGPDEELEKYLQVYATSTEVAHKYADELEISRPVKTRAIAPTGTIGIIGETTTGIEPLYCAAYKRRYKKGASATQYQYVLDPTAKKLVDSGVSPDKIEDAYTLAENVERRVAFQAWVQKFVDHGISSTINLPSWGSELNNENKVQEFGNMLIKYLPNLRGMTVYPDGARDGQPLVPVAYKTAEKHIGEVFVEQADVCDISRGGSCGS